MPSGSSTPPPTYDEALERVLERTKVLGAESVSLGAARGRVLRDAVVADRDQPPFDRSAMDGFAVRSALVAPRSKWPVVGTIAAGGPAHQFQTPMPEGAVMRIATGAPLPVGADAVVPIEQTVVDSKEDPERVRFECARVEPGQNVHRRASDARAQQAVLHPGTPIGPPEAGIAAALGAVQLSVSSVPRITLLTTGDEVRPPEVDTALLGPQQIRNSNGPMLRAFLESLHVPLLHHEHVPDEPEQTLAAAREALSRSHLVLTVGGISVGQRDYLPACWRTLGLQTFVHGVSIQPGRPFLAAAAAAAAGFDHLDDPTLVLGLPGNPVSVLVTAHLFVWPVLRSLLGMEARLPWRPAALAEPVKPKRARQVFRAARQGPQGSVSVIRWQGSGDLMHTAGAEGFVRLPQCDDTLAEGTVVPFLPMVR